MYGAPSADDLALSCDELVPQIRLEEESRVYHRGTQSRTIVIGGSMDAIVFGGLIFGERGAALGMLIDAQSFELAKRMTKREGRLLDQLNGNSCYFELAASPRQQNELSELVENLTDEDRSLHCDAIRISALSSMERLAETADASASESSAYSLFWSGRASGALSNRDAGLILLAEQRGCGAQDP